MDPALVFFAIQSGARLGRKLHDVMVDETRERFMYIPFDYIVGDATLADAWNFFAIPENESLIARGGPYETATEDQIVQAYLSIKTADKEANIAMSPKFRNQTIITLHKFSQERKSLQTRPAFQRILGTIVEIGIDYVIAFPPAGLDNSKTGKVIKSFVAGIDDVDFAESAKEGLLFDLISSTLHSALTVLDDSELAVADDERLKVVMLGIIGALKDAVESVSDTAEEERLKDVGQKLMPSIIKGAAQAVTENMTLFLGEDKKSGKLIHAAASEILDVIQEDPQLEHLFTARTLEGISKAIFLSIGENPDIISDDKVIKDLITRSVEALIKKGPDNQPLFSKAAIAIVIQAGFETVSANAEILISGKEPRYQLISEVVESIATGFAEGLNNTATQKDMRLLFTTERLVGMSKIVFQVVAEHPEKLLQAKPNDPGRRNALTQIIGSVSKAISIAPKALANPKSVENIVRVALVTAVGNVDQLIDIDTVEPETNMLFQVLQKTIVSLLNEKDPRRLRDPALTRDILIKILPVVSASMASYSAKSSNDIIPKVVSAVFGLAIEELKGELNAENLAATIASVLKAVLKNDLDIQNLEKIELYIRDFLIQPFN